MNSAGHASGGTHQQSFGMSGFWHTTTVGASRLLVELCDVHVGWLPALRAQGQ